MSVDVLVFAPHVDDQVFVDLRVSLASHLAITVSLGGYFGPERPSAPTWIDGLADVVAFVDLNRYWAIVKVTLPTVCNSARPFVHRTVCDVVLEWAEVWRKRADQRAKIILADPDGDAIRELDA